MNLLVTALFSRLERGLQRVQSELHDWLLFQGNRFVIAGVLIVVFALSIVSLQYIDIIDVTDTTQMLYLFQGLIGGNLTLVTIVLSINQLVLSRQFKTPGELHDHIENAIEYQNRVRETTNESSVPPTPVNFLSVLFDGTQTNAQRLGSAAEDLDHNQLAEDIDSLVSDLLSHTDHIIDMLDQSHTGIFNALAVMLDTNYSHQLNEAFRLRTVYEDEFSATAHDRLDELIQSLKQMDIARQYFKSIYMQTELARLSRILLYVGVPAIGSGVLMLLIYASTVESPLPVSHLRVLFLVAVTLGFTPLAVLFSFVLRIATVAQYTVAITPFTTTHDQSLINDK